MTFPTRRAFAILALLVAAFVVWMSLIPFDFKAVRASEIIPSIEGLGRPLPPLSRADAVANALVFVALGFFATGAFAFTQAGRVLRVERPAIEQIRLKPDSTRKTADLLAATTAVACSLALSISVECAQVFLPGRDPSLSDVAFQVSGAAVGAAGFVLAGQGLADWARGVLARREHPSAALHALGLYALAYVAWRLAPFEFSVSPRTLWAKMQAGRIAVAPFRGLDPTPEALTFLVELALTAVPLGALFMLLGVRPGRRRTVWRAVVYAVLLLAVLETLIVFDVSRRADTGEVLVGAVGVLVGAVLVRQGSDRPVLARAPTRGVAPLWLAACGWTLVVAVFEWNPFRFTVTKDAIKDGLERLSLLPFAFYARGAPASAFLNLAGKALLCVPLGAIAALAIRRQWPASPRAFRIGFPGVAVAGLMTLLEIGQVFLPHRVPDATDVVVPAAAATAAAWLIDLWGGGGRSSVDEES